MVSNIDRDLVLQMLQSASPIRLLVRADDAFFLALMLRFMEEADGTSPDELSAKQCFKSLRVQILQRLQEIDPAIVEAFSEAAEYKMP